MHKVRGIIIVVVHVGAVKIYVTTVEAVRKKRKTGSKQNETQFGTKSARCISEFDPPPPSLSLMYFFAWTSCILHFCPLVVWAYPFIICSIENGNKTHAMCQTC
jgi:hypothetical protein